MFPTVEKCIVGYSNESKAEIKGTSEAQLLKWRQKAISKLKVSYVFRFRLFFKTVHLLTL